MTDEQLEAAREWAKHYPILPKGDRVVTVADLVDEIDRLRKEVARWRRSFGGHVYVDTDHYADLVRERDDARAEVERLRESLRENVTCMDAEHGGHPTCPHIEEVMGDLRARVAEMERERNVIAAASDAEWPCDDLPAAVARRIEQSDAKLAEAEAENERLRVKNELGTRYMDDVYKRTLSQRDEARADCEIQASKIEELNGLLCEARAEADRLKTDFDERIKLRDDLLMNADDRRITAEQEAISLRSCLTKTESSLDYYKSVVAEGPHILSAGEHGPDECPTYYDGCNCTVGCLEHNIKRAESAERRLAEVEAEREKLANEQDTTRVELAVLVAKLEADLVESLVREVWLRAALEYALEGLCELISYVPAILREKHNHDEYIAETKAALDARRAVAVNAIRNVPHFYWDCTINGLAVLDQDDQTQAGLHAPKICADGGGQCALARAFGVTANE